MLVGSSTNAAVYNTPDQARTQVRQQAVVVATMISCPCVADCLTIACVRAACCLATVLAVGDHGGAAAHRLQRPEHVRVGLRDVHQHRGHCRGPGPAGVSATHAVHCANHRVERCPVSSAVPCPCVVRTHVLRCRRPVTSLSCCWGVCQCPGLDRV